MTDDPRDTRAARDGNANDAPEPASTPTPTQEPANETASLPAPEVAPQETPAPVVETAPEPEPPPAPPASAEAPVDRQAAAPAPTPVVTSWRAPLANALEAKRAKKRARLEQIVALAAKKRRITNNDVQLHVHVSDATATNYLRELVQTGRLKKTGIRAGTRYEPS